MDTDYHIVRKGNVVNVPDCEFFVYSPQTTYCWDAQNASFCLNLPGGVSHGVNPSHVGWTITGPGSTGFDSQIGMQGNQQQGGLCLTIIQIPELAYYPREYNIRVSFNSAQGMKFFNYRVVMYDCTGTKPTCHEYFGSSSFRLIPEKEESELGIEEQNDLTKEDAAILLIHDMLGRLVYEGNPMDWQSKLTSSNQLYIFSYFSEERQLILTEKRVHTY